ncbi:MAG TPA: helix-turn-helix domain-containing protein [Planctomycetota bacterium]|nr:helix-turn-helix domain-containing protein [Planctomycetota bacterium]
MVTQLQIARQLGLDVSTVNKILNKREGPRFRKETIRKVFKVARQLGFDFGRLKYTHHRHHARTTLSVPLELSIYSPDGQLLDRGTATMSEISLSGALLSGIVLLNRAIPLQPHTIGIRILDGTLKDLEIKGTPVRFRHVGGAISVAIEFLKTEDAPIERLRKIV